VHIAGQGVNENVRLSLNTRGYGGPGCGLGSIAKNFAPELIVSSPLSRSLQTALVMFDRCVATIFVCPALKELEIDDTEEGKFIDGSASCQGMTKTMLQAAVEAHPRSSGGLVDFSQVPEDIWYNPLQTYDEKCNQFSEFLQWLAARRERRIAVVTHGNLLSHWLQATFGHSEYAIGKFCMTESGESKTILTRNTDGVQHHIRD
jgi:broad specificity phosphatase PhoE